MTLSGLSHDDHMSLDDIQKAPEEPEKAQPPKVWHSSVVSCVYMHDC